MLLTPLLFLSPLLASAAPFRGVEFQADKPSSIPSAALNGEDISLDLSELRLVSLAEDEPPVWMTELEKIQAKAAGKRFMDVTDSPELGLRTFFTPSNATLRYKYQAPGKHASTVRDAFSTFDLDHMESFLRRFSSFRTRYYRSETGLQSMKWLKEQIQKIIGERSDVSVREFEHSAWPQNSLVVRFEPKEDSMRDEAASIIGVHQDSTNLWPFLPAPGADDDGSGVTSSVTAVAGLIAANYTPVTPVEFHYYSAEEGGLLGSQAIAQQYERDSRKVKAMLQVDMTAYVKPGTKEVIGVIEDFVDSDLTDWIVTLVEKYLDIPPARTKCGYACSDHASFSKAGYQSGFLTEALFEETNHKIHTTEDTVEYPGFSFKHMREFSKLMLAFAAEMGGWAKE